MNPLLLFLRRVLIVFLVGTFISVSTFRGEAIAQQKIDPFKDSCTITPTATQPEFRNPPFAYADTEYKSNNASDKKNYLEIVNPQAITFDAVEDKFYLDVDGSASAGTGYNGYLYKTTFFGKDGKKKTIVRNNDKPGKIEVVDYDPSNPPGNIVGTYTPPTIVVSTSREDNTKTEKVNESRSSSINLELTNDLPVNVQLAGSLPQTKENLESVSQYTNIHYHGFNVSPLLGADDVLVDVPSNVTPKQVDYQNGKAIPVPPVGETTPDSSSGSRDNLPGGYYPGDDPAAPKYGGPITKYTMDVKIPFVHQSGLFWYHSHAHSLSDNQVLGGLSGGIIIKGSDKYYEILSPDPTKGIEAYQNPPIIPIQPEKFSVRQKVMMFKDFNDVLGARTADCFTVNGQVNPKITIKPGEVQLWRMANVGADKYMNIALEETNTENPAFAQPHGKPNFYILARDADFVEKVVPTNSVLLPPASRVDVLVVGGNTARDNSSKYNLVSDLTTKLTEGQKWVPGQKSYLLATVELDGQNHVCYQDNNGNNLGLSKKYDNEGNPGKDKYCSSVADKDLYRYIEKQEPTTQTGGDGDPDVDKILPDPEKLFDGYYVSGRIPVCQNRSQDFVNNNCLTPSTLYSDRLTKKRYFYFSQDFSQGVKFFLKGFENPSQVGVKIKDNDGNNNPPPELQELYDGNRIDKISRVGDLEEWHLVNTTGIAHVFHIHQLDFVVTNVILNQKLCKSGDENCTYNNYKVGTFTGEGNEPSYTGCTEYSEAAIGGDPKYNCPLLPQGYRDVINLPPNSETIVRIPFVNPFITGPFVYHCHILGHEDRGMMHNLKVENTKGYQGADVIFLMKKI